MRYMPGVTAQDRVIHNGTIYGIESLIDVRSNHRELVLVQGVGFGGFVSTPWRFCGHCHTKNHGLRQGGWFYVGCGRISSRWI